MKNLILLSGTLVLLWAALLHPGLQLSGDLVWPQSLAALALCLVPGLATMAWALKSKASPEMRLAAILGGSGIRMAIALGGGLALYRGLPETFTDSFWVWVGVFYLVNLALEVVLLVNTKVNHQTT
ncbi:MAG: hypothetical protein L0Y72_22000 [Gemmataceae bacterium]|nr:hypothetical protein [Gemmataceae bacterium]